MTSVLTENDILNIGHAQPQDRPLNLFAYAFAVEAAVIRKLAAGGSVEPVGSIEGDDSRRHFEWSKDVAAFDSAVGTPVYTATAIAAARVQALEEARDIVLNFQAGWIPDGFTECADAIRALLGKEST